MTDGLVFENKNSLVRASDFEKIKRKISIEITKIKESLSKKEQGYVALNLPNEKIILDTVQEIVKQKQALGVSAIIVIGIGGSILGTEAIYVATQGKLHDETHNLKMLFVDTVDTDTVIDTYNIMESLLKSEKNVVLNVISESGRTTEAISNFEIFLDLLKKHRKDYQKYVVVTTKKDSKLYSLALKNKFDTLIVGDGVGGRYSVLSPVGLFPLGLAGVDIKSLMKGAKNMNERAFKEITKSPSAQSAIDLYCNYREGKCIHDIFIFSSDLEALGKWYRQLLAESLGKKYNLKGYKVCEGITPTVSMGSTDLHSMGQLYLAGQTNRFTTFIKVEPKRKIRIPKEKEYDELVEGIQGKYLSQIMDAIFHGTRIAYIKGKLPFNQISIRKKEYDLGEYMQYEMIKVVILGHLLSVNPFDQPNVEDYKQETREILKR